jgi:hypothetical protein
MATEFTSQSSRTGEGVDYVYEEIRTHKEKKNDLWKIMNVICGKNIEHGMYSSL